MFPSQCTRTKRCSNSTFNPTSQVKHSNRSQQYETSLVTDNKNVEKAPVHKPSKSLRSNIKPKARDGRFYFPTIQQLITQDHISLNNITLTLLTPACLALDAYSLHNSKWAAVTEKGIVYGTCMFWTASMMLSEFHKLTNTHITNFWSAGISVLENVSISKIPGSNPQYQKQEIKILKR